MIYLIVAIWYIFSVIYVIHHLRRDMHIFGIELIICILLGPFLGPPLFVRDVICKLFIKFLDTRFFNKYE